MEGISRKDVESHLKTLAEKEEWSTFNRVFALAIYVIMLFPFSVGVIDLCAISVFQMVEYHRVNPIPAILAETYMALSHCHHAHKGGKMKCCLHLLNVWIMSHLYGKIFLEDKGHDSYNPLASFKDQEGKTRLDRKGSIEVFNQLKAQDIFCKLTSWWGEEIICQCGDFLNVPLLGPRGVINYNPTLLLRQFALPHKVPSKQVVQRIQFMHDDSTKNLSQKVGRAWDRVVYKGKLELGKDLIWETDEHQTWLTERIKRANLTSAPLDPLLSNNATEVDKELIKPLGRKEEELEELMKADHGNKEDLSLLQNDECANLQGRAEEMKRRDACEESSEVKRLKGENLKLKHAINDVHKQVVEFIRQLKRKEEELEELMKADCENTEDLSLLQNECVNLQGRVEKRKRQDACEESSEAKRLKGENLKLNHTINDVHKQVEENEQKMKNNQARLMYRLDCMAIPGSRYEERQIRWNKPPNSWVKLNCDGSVKHNIAAAGGLIRNEFGVWFGGTCRNIGFGGTIQGELWGVVDVLELAWSRGFRRVQLETDSLSVVQLLTNDTTKTNGASLLVHAIKNIIARDWIVEIMHSYREGNRSADFLANYAFSLPLGHHILELPPTGLRAILYDDVMGISIPRLC